MANWIDKEHKNILIETVNKRGFILEDKVWRILTSTPKIANGSFQRRFRVYDGIETAEIDAIFSSNNRTSIIECKRSQYDWIFLKNIEDPNAGVIVKWDKIGLNSINFNVPDFVSAFSGICIKINSGEIVTKNKKEIETPEKDIIYDAANQVLRETELFISSADLQLFSMNTFLPVIVTNANIGIIKYSGKNINEIGDLVDCTMPENLEPFVLLNVPYVMRPRNIKIQAIKTSSKELGYMKSVFVVNVNCLEKFIEILSKQNW